MTLASSCQGSPLNESVYGVFVLMVTLGKRVSSGGSSVTRREKSSPRLGHMMPMAHVMTLWLVCRCCDTSPLGKSVYSVGVLLVTLGKMFSQGGPSPMCAILDAMVSRRPRRDARRGADTQSHEVPPWEICLHNVTTNAATP